MDLKAAFLKTEDSLQQRRLLKTLGHSQIALLQALAYIRSKNEGLNDQGRRFRINDYLQEYEKKRKAFANLGHIKKKEDKVIFITTQLILDRIKNDDQAVEILNIIAYLDYEENIPLEMFSSMIKDEKELKNLFQLLDRYYIISFNEKQKVFSVNCSVQNTIRSNTRDQEESILDKALILLKLVRLDNVAHAVRLWNRATKFSSLVKKHHSSTSEIMNIFLNGLGLYQDALTFGEEVLKVLKQTLGSNHSGTLKLENDIARAITGRGQTAKAIGSLKGDGKSLMKDPTVYLANQCNIARTLSNEGKLQEALPVFQEVYEGRQNLLGLKHVDTLITRSWIALLKFILNYSFYDISLMTLGAVVKEFKEHYSEETLTFLHNIGCDLNQSARYDEALKILQEVHQKRKLLLGEDHPLTLKTYRNVGSVLMNKEEHEKALKTSKEVYKKQEKNLGRDQPETLDTEHSMKLIDALNKDKVDNGIIKIIKIACETIPDSYRQDIGLILKFERALILHKIDRHEDALVIMTIVTQDKLRMDNWLKLLACKLVLNLKSDIAKELLKQGKYQEALDTYNEVLVGLMNSGVDKADVFVLTTESNIALSLLELGKYQESFTIFKEVSFAQEIFMGVNHINTLITKSNLARVLSKQNKLEESLSLYREVVDKLKKTYGERYLIHTPIIHNMAVVLAKTHRYDEAIKLLNEIVAKRKSFGLEDNETLKAQESIANALFMQEKYKEALNIFQEVLDKRKEMLGLSHPHSLMTQFWIAKVLVCQEKYSEALQIFDQVLEGQKQVLGDEHPNILSTKFEMMKAMKLKSNSINSMNPSESIADSDNLKLHCTINSGNLVAVNDLLSGEFDITQVTVPKGNTPLHIASLKGDNKIVESILRYAKQQLDSEKLSGFINAQTTSGKNTSLHVAAQKGYLDVTRTLLKHGAMYNLKNRENKIPVDLVTDENILNLLKLIGELFENTEHGKSEVIDRLSKLKKDEFLAVTNALNNRGHTLLQANLALSNKYKDIAAGLSQMMGENSKQ